MILRLLAWAFVACAGILAVSQVTPRGSAIPPVYVGQALSPFVFAAMVPLALVALWQRELLLGLTAAACALPLLVLSGPLVHPVELARPDPSAPTLRILSSNIYWHNPRPQDAYATLLAQDADVIVISEITPEMNHDLEDLHIRDTYPYRAGTTDDWDRGVALWSKYPIVASDLEKVVGQETVEAVLDVDGTAIRVIGSHPSQPISHWGRQEWRPALIQLTDLALQPEAPPTVLLGDLNASYWHPPFRDMLDAGLIDAHIALGHPLSPSWPANTIVPPWVRIDHALLAPNMTATDVRDVRIPGSDHIALVVTVTPAQG